MSAVGVWGVGTYLPEEVRTNDWWPERIVQAWRTKDSGKVDRPAERAQETATLGARMVLEAMAELRHDPFRGARAALRR